MASEILKLLGAFFLEHLPAALRKIFEAPQAILDAINASTPPNTEYAEILRAARVMGKAEFAFLQWAFADWHGREMTEYETNRFFKSFILEQKIPWWARETARKVIRDGEGDGGAEYA